MIDVILPLPPSTNGLFATVGKRRVTAPRYLEWQDFAGWEIKRQRPAAVPGRYDLAIYIPAAMRGDADNRIKAVSDILVKHRLIDDDAKARRVVIERCEDITAGKCRVIVQPAEIA